MSASLARIRAREHAHDHGHDHDHAGTTPTGMDILPTLAVIRIGLGQMALGMGSAVLTATLNRVLTVEDALPAVIPGLLIALHYLIQIIRPQMGHRSDISGRRGPFVVLGAGMVGACVLLAAIATALLGHGLSRAVALPMATIAYGLAGIGMSMSGTSLLAMLSARVPASRAAQSAAIVWAMMIAGIVAAAICGAVVLTPFSRPRLIGFSALIGAAIPLLALLASGVEPRTARGPAPGADPETAAPRTIASGAASGTTSGAAFRKALGDVWRDPRARRFTVFILCSMLAYSAQEVLIEPFAARVLRLGPAGSAGLTGLQNGCALAGMLLIAVLPRAGRSARGTALWGCGLAAAGLLGLALCGLMGLERMARAALGVQGFGNGVFVSGAVGTMLALAGRAGRDRGLRMGLWGATQAIAFAFGGAIASGFCDLGLTIGRHDGQFGAPVVYAAAFGLAAIAYLAAARAIPERET